MHKGVSMAQSKTDAQVDVKIASDEIVDKWFVENFNGVVGMTVEIYNKAHEAKELLKKQLKGE